MANRRTAVPEGYYVVEGSDGRLTPYHRTDDMLFSTSSLMTVFPPGTLIPIGPSFAYYKEAARFCYDRAGVPWPHRKRVAKRGEKPGTSTPSGRETATPKRRRVLPEVVEETSGKRSSKRSNSRGGASGVSE